MSKLPGVADIDFSITVEPSPKVEAIYAAVKEQLEKAAASRGVHSVPSGHIPRRSMAVSAPWPYGTVLRPTEGSGWMSDMRMMWVGGMRAVAIFGWSGAPLGEPMSVAPHNWNDWEPVPEEEP